MFRQESQVHWCCLGGDSLGSRTAVVQLYYCDPQVEGIYTFILHEKANILMRWVNQSNSGKNKEFFLFIWCWQILT